MAGQPRIIITETLDDTCAAWLAERAEVVWCHIDEAERFNELLPTADALVVRTYTQVDEALLARAAKLKVIGRAGVGLDNFDLPACQKRKVKVVYTPAANTQAVVEYVTALVLDAFRPLAPDGGPWTPDHFHDLRKTHVGRQVEELTLGVLGFGRIGKRIGEVARAIGLNLHVNDLLPEVELRKAVDYPFEFVTVQKLFAESDILTIHVDGRASNRHFISAAALGQLKPGCLLVNTSRGMVIDAAALADWLQANPDARAILDVHDPEPPPADYVLWDLPNVRLLPHLASRTHTAMKNMSWVVKDVMAVLDDEEPSYPAW